MATLKKFNLMVNQEFDTKQEVVVYLEDIAECLHQSDFNAGEGWELEVSED